MAFYKALPHGVAWVAIAAFGVSSSTAWLTQASGRWQLFCDVSQDGSPEPNRADARRSP